jgi:hypothetical protein
MHPLPSEDSHPINPHSSKSSLDAGECFPRQYKIGSKVFYIKRNIYATIIEINNDTESYTICNDNDGSLIDTIDKYLLPKIEHNYSNIVKQHIEYNILQDEYNELLNNYNKFLADILKCTSSARRLN